VAEVWTGAVDSDWGTAGNWQGGVVPGTSSAVEIPDDASLPSHVMPVLGADAEIIDLSVGVASTLGLGGFTLKATGNVDVVGQVTNGTLWMSGTGALLGGSVDELKVDGRVTLQAPVVSTSGVSVGGTGSLSVQNNGLFVQIP
jgi:trimeric autotransporter adhesin